MLSILAVLSHALWLGFASYRQIKIDGDLIFGGLFPVHEKGDRSTACGVLSEGRGIHRVEAMLFALDKINSNRILLPGIRLGARILDSCANPSHALNLSLVFVRELMGAEVHHYRCDDRSQPSLRTIPQPVAGVIGGSYSGVSVQTAHLLRLFEIVQISPASTSTDLSDKTRFNYFARTVPSDVFQARAALDVARKYNWTYVSLVYSSGEYGEALAEGFKIHARRLNICVALEEKVSRHGQVKGVVERLFDAVISTDRGPRVVVLFTTNHDTRVLLQQAYIQGKRQGGKKLQWLAADGWETRDLTTQGWEEAAEDAIVITLDAHHVADFESYFLSLHPSNPISTRNMWFAEFWETKFNCSLRHDSLARPHHRQCNHNHRLRARDFQSDDKVQFVIDAVYALAYALHDMWRENCLGVPGACPALKRISGKYLYENYLLNVSFRSIAGHQFNFDSKGDGPANYRFMNFQLVDGEKRKYDYVEIGNWRQGRLTLDEERILWSSYNGTPPHSICTPECPVGERKELMVKGEGCCWACIPCADHQFMQSELVCVDCPPGYWPRPNRKTCFPLPIAHMEWDSPYSIVACTLASIGAVTTFKVIIIYVKYWDTPVIKASGRELSCTILTGVLLCFGVTYFVLSPPTKLICGLRRVGVGLGFAVLYSAMLVKTNRIYRIFASAQTARRCRFISPVSQIVITCGLISIQILASLIWLAVEPPSVKFVYPTKYQVVAKCAQDDHWFLMSLTYDAALIILCTVYAVRTRMVPENFNEAKFIGFTMYTTCIIWLAFVALYFGTESDFKIQLTTLSICITLSATVALLCLFAPKMWIVLFEPEKNIRRHAATATFGSQWATLLVPNPNIYTPLLGLRPVPGTQNVFLASALGDLRDRALSMNSGSVNLHNGPGNAIVMSEERTSADMNDYN